MKKRSIAAVVLAAAISATASIDAQTKSAEKPFVAGGKVTIQLDGGDYEVRAAPDNRVRVTLSGNTGKATTDVSVAGSQATVNVRNTPHSNFKGVVEVPKVADIVIRLSGGDLSVGAITGSKDVEMTGGDLKITVGSASDYASVDAQVKAGDLSAGPFAGSASSGLLSHSVKWSGKGKYTLHARLGAGDLVLR
jgi:hypothetical protein